MQWSDSLFKALGFSAILHWKIEFRRDVKDGGLFKDGLTLLYSIAPDGYVVFHALDPWREGRIVINNPDARGDTTFVRRIIQEAQSGGGFVDYYWDNPDDPDDDQGELSGRLMRFLLCPKAYRESIFSQVLFFRVS
ncbi:MAG: cache domain-containing protein [Bacteroidota bacterium]|nr:cache domain-containing protein [Bacteroidota bacterium]